MNKLKTLVLMFLAILVFVLILTGIGEMINNFNPVGGLNLSTND